MKLADYYKRQFAWRDWKKIFDSLPVPLSSQTVLDLGCGIGDLANEFVIRGANVIGIDVNEELLQAAQSRGLSQATFLKGDLRSLPDVQTNVDGIWCSFAAAYFTDFATVLRSWLRHLREGAWIALVEIDDFFGHRPTTPRTKGWLDSYASEALAAGRYDFFMGRKLQKIMEGCGLRETSCMTVNDRELSFRGPADFEILEAWRTRLNGMKLLQEHCGAAFPDVRDDFLHCLSHPDHHSAAKVYCCIAVL